MTGKNAHTTQGRTSKANTETNTLDIEDIKSSLTVPGILKVVSTIMKDYQKAAHKQRVAIATRSTTNSMALNNANERKYKLVKEKEDMEQKASNIKAQLQIMAGEFDRLENLEIGNLTREAVILTNKTKANNKAKAALKCAADVPEEK